MQIIYFWIDDGNKFKCSGFNLSPEYRVDMKKDDMGIYKLTCVTTEIPNIMTEMIIDQENPTAVIENATAFVGENGSGKTSIMKELFMRKCEPRKDAPEKTKYLYVIKDGITIFAETNLLHNELDYYSNPQMKIYSADFDYDEETDRNEHDDGQAGSNDKYFGKGVYNFTSI